MRTLAVITSKALIEAVRTLPGQRLGLCGREVPIDKRLSAEILWVDNCYQDIENRTIALVKAGATNLVPKTDRSLDLTLSSILIKHASITNLGFIERSLGYCLHSCAKEGVDFLPQGLGALHFDLATAAGTEAEPFREFLTGIVPTLPRPLMAIGGMMLSREGGLMLKGYPLNDSILSLREAAGQQDTALYSITIGQLTEQIAPKRFKLLSDTVRSVYGGMLFGVYEIPSAFMMTKETMYIAEPNIIEEIPFATP